MTTWRHRECGAPVMWDLSGGFCTGCHAEDVDPDDCQPDIPDYVPSEEQS